MILVICFLALSLSQVVSENFNDVEQGYQFNYHDSQNLLLVVHDNDCYFASLPDGNEKWTESDTLKKDAERLIVDYIEGRATPPPTAPASDDDDDGDDASSNTVPVQISNSTLEEMRNQFQDRLADFQCLQKTVYQIELQKNFWQPPSTGSDGDDK